MLLASFGTSGRAKDAITGVASNSFSIVSLTRVISIFNYLFFLHLHLHKSRTSAMYRSILTNESKDTEVDALLSLNL